MQTMIRLSPLHQKQLSLGATFGKVSKWQVAQTFSQHSTETSTAQEDVTLSDLSDRAKVMIEGDGAEALLKSVYAVSNLAINAGKTIGNDLHVYRLRRDRFYISGPTGTETTIVEQLNTALSQIDSLTTVTDVTNGRAELLLVGPKSAECLSRLCGLDFYESEFPKHTAKQSSVAKTRQLVIRRDMGELPTYTLSGGRSLAVYLWETIMEAGRDLQIRPMGRKALEALALYDRESLSP